MKLALLSLYKQLVLKQVLEYLVDMVELFLGVKGKDQDVNKADKGAMVEVLKDIINQCLEDHWGVSEAKGHDVFKIPEGCFKGSLPLVPLLNPDQLVGVPQVQLCEDGCSVQGLKCRVKHWNGDTCVFLWLYG